MIRDKIEKGGIEVENFPTESMRSNILEKPKEGNWFCLFRDELMNVPDYYDNEVEFINTRLDLLDKEETIISRSEVLSQITENIMNKRESSYSS